MDVIVKSKWLFYGILLEFLVVAAYFNAKLFLAYPYVMGIVYASFCGCMAAVFVYRKRRYKKASNWWIFYKCSGTILKGMCSLLMLIVAVYGVKSALSCVKTASGTGKITTAQAEEIAVKNRGESILEHSDLLQQLSPEIYRDLSVQEKTNLLYRVVQIEAEYLGIEAPALQCAALEKNTVGTYIKEEHLVLLNEGYLQYEETTLRGLLHEMYHAYQYACVSQVEETGDLLMFRRIEQWKREYKFYSDSKEGYLEYYLQSMESTARKYSEDRLSEYGKLIVLGNTP